MIPAVTIAVFNSIDIILFSIAILLIIIAQGFNGKGYLPLSARYRTVMAFSILIILVLDLLARTAGPFTGTMQHQFRYGVNFAYMILQPLPVSLGLMYLFSIFRERPFPLKWHMVFLLPFFAGCIVMGYSLFTDWIFYIDADNVYRRGPGMFAFGIINYSYIVPAAALILRYRDAVKRRTLVTVIAFTIIPCAGSLLQLFAYGIVTAWPSFVLAQVIVYFFLESRRSDRDYLTGMMNRQSFEAKAYARIMQIPRKGPFTLVMIDLDKFKAINDNFGHDKGDEALQAAAAILSHSVSVSDTVARYGGDEFVLLLETGDLRVAESVLARIRKNAATWNAANDYLFTLSFSAGCAIHDSVRHKSYADLFREADKKMFEMKALLK